MEGRRGDRRIKSHSYTSVTLSFYPDGRMLATAGALGFVRLWDPETGAELRRLGEPGDRLTVVAFSPDGRTLAAAGADANIRLWDLGELRKPRADP